MLAFPNRFLCYASYNAFKINLTSKTISPVKIIALVPCWHDSCYSCNQNLVISTWAIFEWKCLQHWTHLRSYKLYFFLGMNGVFCTLPDNPRSKHKTGFAVICSDHSTGYWLEGHHILKIGLVILNLPSTEYPPYLI